MKLLDLSLSSPAENLACDEALLNRGEADGGEVLRFWEVRKHFVVVGYANKVEAEVNRAACAARKIPIFRRCSGGGAVLQGPGCLNYTLILQISAHPSFATISSANKFIMERNCEAVQSAIANHQPPIAVSVCGHTDLAIAAAAPEPGEGRLFDARRKFSGNSQRRQKHALLFHGTFLLNFDLQLVNEVLRMPSKQPDYRHNRFHSEFLANLNLPADRVKHALATVWNTAGELNDFPKLQMRRLAQKKYSTLQWNFKL